MSVCALRSTKWKMELALRYAEMAFIWGNTNAMMAILREEMGALQNAKYR